MFFKYYSGHIHNCYRALRCLVEEQNEFDPFVIAQPDKIQQCIQDPGVQSPACLCNWSIDVEDFSLQTGWS